MKCVPNCPRNTLVKFELEPSLFDMTSHYISCEPGLHTQLSCEPGLNLSQVLHMTCKVYKWGEILHKYHAPIHLDFTPMDA